MHAKREKFLAKGRPATGEYAGQVETGRHPTKRKPAGEVWVSGG
jgi:hypothetical protein